MAAVEMAPPIEKQVPKSIFEGCSLDGINSLKNGAVEYLEKIVAKESEEDLYQFFLPKKIWSDLDKTIISVKDLTSGKSQAHAIKTREKSVSTAIADSTQHILKFLYPGQVLILSMLDEIRIENKSLKKQIKTLEEWTKKNDINELLLELKCIRAELAEIKENSTGKDQVDPGNGIKLNQRQNTNVNAKKPTMFQPKGIDGQPLPGMPMEEVKKKNKRKRNQGKNEDTNTGPKYSESPGPSEGIERDESQDAPYTEVRSKRKNRGPRAPEVRPRNKREQLASQEIIIHGLKTPENNLDKMAEAVLIMDTLDELDPKWLGYNKGVIVDMTKNIAFHERIVGHFDGTKGCQPVKIRFRSQKFCDRVKRAAGAAGALNGRKSIHTGKYKIPRVRDSQGIPMKEDNDVIERSKN